MVKNSSWIATPSGHEGYVRVRRIGTEGPQWLVRTTIVEQGNTAIEKYIAAGQGTSADNGTPTWDGRYVSPSEVKKNAPDMINQPPHYTAHPSGVECIQITEHMGFNLGNAVKYLWRADLKGQSIEDLKKAVWYVQREITKRERQG